MVKNGVPLVPVALLAALTLSPAQASLLVMSRLTGAKVAEFRDASASFGRSLPDDGLLGALVQADPPDACRPLRPAPTDLPEGRAFALIARYGGCNFEEKVRAAQKANFSAAVVHNVGSDKLVPMGGEDAGAVPSVFIGASDAEVLRRHFSNYRRYALLLTDDGDFDLSAYLLPFIIVAGICMAVMLAVVCFKCVQDHRRKRRHRLPRSALKRLPVVKWKQGDPYDCCAVCLEDFAEGDKLRVLPCDHAYHAKCIDPWLVKNKRICPQCRARVFGGETGGGGAGSDTSETEDESAPLLRNARNNRGYGNVAEVRPPGAVASFPASDTSGASASVLSESAPAATDQASPPAPPAPQPFSRRRRRHQRRRRHVLLQEEEEDGVEEQQQQQHRGGIESTEEEPPPPPPLPDVAVVGPAATASSHHHVTVAQVEADVHVVTVEPEHEREEDETTVEEEDGAGGGGEDKKPERQSGRM